MARLLNVFNRYVFMGGEEKSMERIYRHLGEEHDMALFLMESKDWIGPQGIPKPVQLRRTMYNWESRRMFEEMIDRHHPDAAIFHNVFPVGSPSLFHAAQLRGLPVIQYVHNFRPFSVGGTLYARGKFMEKSLQGNFWPEVRAGAWQDSVIKSAIMALVLKRLQRSGWLDSVKAWVAVSEFMREKFVHSVGLPSDRVHALRHSMDVMPQVPEPRDGGYYLFLSRLVEVKGVETLLQAWKILESELGEQTPELRVGGEGPLEAMVREAQSGSSKIKFLGLVDGTQKHEEILACRAMLAPSIWWEPLGLVTYEAYDYAKPMLAARSGGLIETVLHGETGWHHEPGDPESLARDVCRTESMLPEERLAMGAKGRAWLLANTSVPEWKRAFHRILASVL